MTPRCFRERSCAAGGRPGFTLFELILSLTIMAVLLVLIFGAMRLGSRAWDRGERDLSLDQQERVVLEMMRHQIASWTYFTDKPGPDDTGVLPVSGSASEFRFFSNAGLLPGRGFPPMYVVYTVVQEADNSQSLYLFEESRILFSIEEIRTQSTAADAAHPLIQNMERILLEYWVHDRVEDFGEGGTTWNPDDGNVALLAVKVSFWDGRSDQPLSMVARPRMDDE